MKRHWVDNETGMMFGKDSDNLTRVFSRMCREEHENMHLLIHRLQATIIFWKFDAAPR